MPRRSRRNLPLAPVWIVMVACGGVPRAAAQSRTRTPERIEPGLFHLRQLDASMELESTFERTRVRSEDGTGRTNARQSNTNSINQSFLGLTLAGDVVHPYLIAYTGSLRIGYSESRYRENTLTVTNTDRSSGFLSEFDLRADLFRTKPLSGTVYGQRGQDRVGRLFLPSLRERRNAYGTSWVYRREDFTAQLSFDHVETTRSGNRDRRDDERMVEDALRLSTNWTISEHQKLLVDAEHVTTQQEFQGTEFNFDNRRDQVRLDYTLEFGPAYQHRFATRLRFQEESGDLAQDIAEYAVQLDLQHTPTLSTRYLYQFTRERLGAINIDLNRGEFQLRHQFLTNLTTTFDAFGLTERTDEDIDTNQGGASIDWNYTRNNPWGRLTAELRVAGDSEQTRGNAGRRQALNESGTFRDPLPLYLIKPNVARASITVTDLTGRVVYQAGSDYHLVSTGDRTALAREPSGRITNGQTVLIDYRYESPAGGRIDTTRIDFNLEQAFAFGLTPYYRFAFRRQDVDRTTGFGFIADGTDHHRIGVTLDRSGWSAGAEYEVFDDTIEPYDAFHLTGTFQAIRDERQSLDLQGAFSRYFFEGGFDRRNVSEINLSLSHEFRINERWTTHVASAWRWEDDSVRGNTNGFDVESTLAYRRGNMSVEFSLDYDVLSIAGSREDGFGAFLALRWDIEDVLGRNQ